MRNHDFFVFWKTSHSFFTVDIIRKLKLSDVMDKTGIRDIALECLAVSELLCQVAREAAHIDTVLNFLCQIIVYNPSHCISIYQNFFEGSPPEFLAAGILLLSLFVPRTYRYP